MTSTLRLDGLYRSPRKGDVEGVFWLYLRFFEDGTVIGVTSSGQPNEVFPWFRQENPNVSVSRYALSGDLVSFSSSSRFAQVDYEGEIDYVGSKGGLPV